MSRLGRNVALKVDYGTNASATDRKSLSTTRYFKNNTKKIQNQKIEDDVDGYNYRVQLVYVEPLPWRHFLQLRYSYQYRVNNSDRFTVDLILMERCFIWKSLLLTLMKTLVTVLKINTVIT